MAGIRVLVVDAQRLFAHALSMALEGFPDFDVLPPPPPTGVAATGLEAVTAASRWRPDIMLLDYWLAEMDGPTATRAITEWHPETKILLLSWFHGPEQVQAGLEAGAAGFLPKSLDVFQVAEAIRRAAAGESPVYAEKLQDLVATINERADEADDRFSRLLTLTPRELDVLRLLGYGLPMQELADLLSIARGTLRNHIQNILNKLGARSRIEAIAMAREARLFEGGEAPGSPAAIAPLAKKPSRND